MKKQSDFSQLKTAEDQAFKMQVEARDEMEQFRELVDELNKQLCEARKSRDILKRQAKKMLKKKDTHKKQSESCWAELKRINSKKNVDPDLKAQIREKAFASSRKLRESSKAHTLAEVQYRSDANVYDAILKKHDQAAEELGYAEKRFEHSKKMYKEAKNALDDYLLNVDTLEKQISIRAALAEMNTKPKPFIAIL